MSPASRRYARKEPPAVCPFCEAKIPRPTLLTEDSTPDAPRGGRCPGCDALYVMDENGKQGGLCLIQALTLAADGDQEAGMAMKVGEDYTLTDRNYNPRTHSLDPKSGRRRFGVPKLWFVKVHRGQPAPTVHPY